MIFHTQEVPGLAWKSMVRQIMNRHISFLMSPVGTVERQLQRSRGRPIYLPYRKASQHWEELKDLGERGWLG